MQDPVGEFEASVVEFRPRIMRALATNPPNRRFRAKFAVLEANRTIEPSNKRLEIWFYRLFLIGNFLFPALIVLWSPRAWSFCWDLFGLISTTILVIVTYGSYAFEAFHLLLFGGPDEEDLILEITQRQYSQHNALIIGNTAFCFLGFVLTAFAVACLVFYWKFGVWGDNESAYRWFFGYQSSILLIAILFVAIDRTAAKYELSHRETCRAVSSMVFASWPVLLGILILWIHSASIVAWGAINGNGWHFIAIPVQFISGALSFQMIVSNILFIQIKRDQAAYQMYKYVSSTAMD
jgi:hypothetical protein